MAGFARRRILAGTLPAILAVLLLGPGAPSRSPALVLAGTDVFGTGTGGQAGSHGTSLYADPGDATGWGIRNLKPETPPAPPPAGTPPGRASDFDASDIGTGALGGNGFGSTALGEGVGGSNLGGALAPLDQ